MSDTRLPLREAITKLEHELWGERPADEIRPQWDALYAVADRYEDALQAVATVENTRNLCGLHGGPADRLDYTVVEHGEDEVAVACCACSTSLDAGQKAREIAREALGA